MIENVKRQDVILFLYGYVLSLKNFVGVQEIVATKYVVNDL